MALVKVCDICGKTPAETIVALVGETPSPETGDLYDDYAKVDLCLNCLIVKLNCLLQNKTDINLDTKIIKNIVKYLRGK